MKGIAVQLPDDLYEELDELAAESYEGDLNRAVRETLRHGSEYRSLKSAWESAPVWRRFRWAMAGDLFSPD